MILMFEQPGKEFKFSMINLLKNLAEKGANAWKGGEFQERYETII